MARSAGGLCASCENCSRRCRNSAESCGDACPIYPGKKYEDWELEDPAGQDVDAVRKIRDEIDTKVQYLIAELLPE